MLKILPQSTFLRLQNLYSVIRDDNLYNSILQNSNCDVLIVARNRNYILVSSIEISSVGTLFHIPIPESSIRVADFCLLEGKSYSSTDAIKRHRLPLLAVASVALADPAVASSDNDSPDGTQSVLLCYPTKTENAFLLVTTLSVDAVFNIRLIPIVNESNHVPLVLIVVTLSSQVRLYTVKLEFINEEYVLSNDIQLISTIDTKIVACIEIATVVNSNEEIKSESLNERALDNIWKVVILSSDGHTFTFHAIDIQNQSDQLTANLVHNWVLSESLDDERDGHWMKITFDNSGLYVAAAHSSLPYVYVWNTIERIVTHRFLLQQESHADNEGHVDARHLVASSICFNLESSLLACAVYGEVLIFSLDSCSRFNAATRAANNNTEFNCMASFDILGIPIPAFNLNLDFLLWGPAADTNSSAAPSSAISTANNMKPAECIGRIPNLGNKNTELLCKFLSEMQDRNILQILDVEENLCYEYEVLDSGRCFRRVKRKLDFSISDMIQVDLCIETLENSSEDNSSSLPSVTGSDYDSEAEIDPMNCIHMDDGAIPSIEGNTMNKDFDIVIDNDEDEDSSLDSEDENVNTYSIILQDSNTVTFINSSVDGQDDFDRREPVYIPIGDNSHPYNDREPDLTYEPLPEHVPQFRFVNSSSSAEGAIVLDCGSGNCKVGFAGSAQPYACFPSLVGRPKYADVMEDSFLGNFTGANSEMYEWRDCYVGNDAQQLRGVLSLQHPVTHGEIMDWESIELLWRHAFYDRLNLPEDSASPSVLLTESPLAPAKHREQCVQVMFESLHVQALCLKVQAALSLFSLGRSTGCVLESGDGVTQSVPILEGYTVASAVRTLDLAGCNVTAQLTKLLRQKGFSLHKTSAEFEIVRDIKERWAFVSAVEADGTPSDSIEEETHELPDGQIIRLKDERFLCTEILFQPHIVGKEIPGIHGCLYQSINACDIDIREEMFSTIVLAGGNSLLAGFGSRLRKELTALTGRNGKFHIIEPNDRLNAAWIGGSIMASLSTFPELCISRSEYDEYGPSLVHSKCM